MHPYVAAPILRRHDAAVVLRDVLGPHSSVEYNSGARISSVELMRMLHAHIGKLVKLRFRPSLTGTPNTISWEALDQNANVVSGKVILHAAVSDNEIVSWAEVLIERRPVDPVAERVALQYIRRQTEGLVRVDDEDAEDDPQEGDGHVRGSSCRPHVT